MASSSLAHMGCSSQYLLAPTENPPAASNHFPKCSLAASHRRKSLASFGAFEYFMIPCENAMWYAHVPAVPLGIGPCWMSCQRGWPFSSLSLSAPRLAAMKMEAPLRVALISPARKARLLFVSSQAALRDGSWAPAMLCGNAIQRLPTRAAASDWE